MGRGHGGSKGILRPGDSSYKGEILMVESLKNIENPEVYRAMKEAISRYHSALGIRQRDIKLAVLEGGVLGVHMTDAMGKSAGVFLNSTVFKPKEVSVKSITTRVQTSYKSGHLTKTKKPVAHVVTHELAHATWNSHLTGERHAAAGKEIRALYKSWTRDTRKRGYGRYADTNVSEFFAETVTKAVHGKADKYTVAVKGIIKKYGL